MRLIFVLDTFRGGGKERRCLQLFQGLAKSGKYELLVIIINDGIDYPELFDTNAQIIVIDRKNKGKSLLRVCKELHQSIKAFNPDVLQVWGLFSALFTSALKPFCKYKYVTAYIADADSPTSLKDRVSNKIGNYLADAIIGNSIAGIKAYSAPQNKTSVIYNGFNEKRYEKVVDKLQKRKELGVNTNYMVCMVASFWKNKDYNSYIKAAKLIIENRKDISFLAVGKGPLLDEMENMIADNYSKYIHFTGFRYDVDEILMASDLSILCSNHGEGISNTIMESMAWGVPVIATGTGGTPEIINDGINGILLPDNNPQYLADKIISLIDDDLRRMQMGANARVLVRNRFSLSRMTNEYMNLYERITK